MILVLIIIITIYLMVENKEFRKMAIKKGEDTVANNILRLKKEKERIQNIINKNNKKLLDIDTRIKELSN